MGTSISEAIESYLYSILSLEPKTRSWYQQKLQVFGDWCQEKDVMLEMLKAAHLRQFIEDLKTRPSHKPGQQVSSYTLHGYIQVLKTFLTWCSNDEDYEDIITDKLIRKIPKIKVDVKVIEVFTDDQINRLYKACKREYNDFLRERDDLILALFLGTGIRSGELQAVK